MFVAELSSTGAHVFSTRIGASTVAGAGVATNGPRIAVSGTTRTRFFYKQLVVFDADHPPSIDIGQLSDNGRGGSVAMSPSGLVDVRGAAPAVHRRSPPVRGEVGVGGR